MTVTASPGRQTRRSAYPRRVIRLDPPIPRFRQTSHRLLTSSIAFNVARSSAAAIKRRALDDESHRGRHAEEDEPVLQDGEEQDAEDDAPDRAAPAVEGHAAEHDAGQHVEFEEQAERSGRRAVEKHGVHDAGDAGHRRGHHVAGQDGPPDVDPREECRFLVDADRERMPARRRPGKNEASDDDDDDRGDAEIGNAENAGIRDRGELVGEEGVDVVGRKQQRRCHGRQSACRA